MTENIYDVTIIGGGPAGLFSTFYSGLREMKTKIIESQQQLGGKVHVYPEKMIWDVGALTPISGEKLIEQMVEQALTFEPTVVLGEKVTKLMKNSEGHFVIETASGEVHFSKTVIMAIGGGILNPQKLEIEGAEKYEVSNLNYTIKALRKFKDKVVVISGGGHTAVDWANELEPIAKQVYVVYRQGALNGHEAQVSQVMNSSVECLFFHEISKLLSDEKRESIEAVELVNNQTGEKTLLKVDEVVVNHGYEREKKLLEDSDFQLEMVNEYYIKGTPFSETSEPGLYAVGDAVDYEGKVHLIAGAFQDAVNAVNKAKQYIEPHAEQRGMVSSHNDVFLSRNRQLIDQLI